MDSLFLLAFIVVVYVALYFENKRRRKTAKKLMQDVASELGIEYKESEPLIPWLSQTFYEAGGKFKGFDVHIATRGTNMSDSKVEVFHKLPLDKDMCKDAKKRHNKDVHKLFRGTILRVDEKKITLQRLIFKDKDDVKAMVEYLIELTSQGQLM